jgi:hypothetical protein
VAFVLGATERPGSRKSLAEWSGTREAAAVYVSARLPPNSFAHRVSISRSPASSAVVAFRSCARSGLGAARLSACRQLSLALKEAIQVRRAIDHIAHMPDRFVHNCPNLIPGHTAPAFAERVIFR